MTDQSVQGRWPDFIGIGAIKSGTTWLHACIAEHPEVFTPPTKEIEYFNRRFKQGEDWYKGFFPATESRVSGESTPGYMHDENCASRIHRANPAMRLLVCLRNPTDRAFSHYMMAHRLSPASEAEKLTEFDKLARSGDNKFVEFGLYANQLRPYLQLFGPASIHLSLFDSIEACPQEMVRSVYRFLGVNAAFTPTVLNTVVNKSALYRHAGLFGSLRKIVQASERTFLAPLILRLKTGGVRDNILSWWRVPQATVEMLPQTREYLLEYYREPNALLAREFKIDVARWSEAD